jgi:hypothetical protein
MLDQVLLQRKVLAALVTDMFIGFLVDFHMAFERELGFEVGFALGDVAFKSFLVVESGGSHLILWNFIINQKYFKF